MIATRMWSVHLPAPSNHVGFPLVTFVRPLPAARSPMTERWDDPRSHVPTGYVFVVAMFDHGERTTLVACDRCGAVVQVVDTALHDQHHNALTST